MVALAKPTGTVTFVDLGGTQRTPTALNGKPQPFAITAIYEFGLGASTHYSTKDAPTQELPNRVNSSGGVATRGSTDGVDANDPTLLDHTGTHYARLPGITSNSLSVPDSAALSIIGDIDIRYELAGDDYTPAGASTLIAKRGAAGQISWQFRIEGTSSGKLQFLWSKDGTATASALSTVATGFTDGVQRWVRITVDVDNGASDADITFYTSTDGSSWTPLGDVVNPGSTQSFFDSTVDITLGLYQTSHPYTHSMHRAMILDGIDGTTVLDINPSVDIDTTTDPDAGQTSFTCTTGQTVTVNRAASGLVTTIVTRPVAVLDGTDDYIQLPADDTPTFTATTGKHTVIYFGRWHIETANTRRIYSAESAGNDGLHIHSNTAGVERPRFTLGGATTAIGVDSPGAATLIEREAFVTAAVIDNGTLYTYLFGHGRSAGTSITGVGTITFDTPRLGSQAFAVAVFTGGEFLDFLTYQDQAKTEAELDVIAADLIAGNYT